MTLGVLFVLMTGTARISNGQYTSDSASCFLHEGKIEIVNTDKGTSELKGWCLQLNPYKYCLFGDGSISVVDLHLDDNTLNIDGTSFTKQPCPDSLEARIDFSAPSRWKKDNEKFWNGDEEIVSEQVFKSGNARITTGIYSFQRENAFGTKTNIDKRIDGLAHRKTQLISGRNCFIGYEGENTKTAYIMDRDYVYRVQVSSDKLTEKQEKAFEKVLSSFRLRK